MTEPIQPEFTDDEMRRLLTRVLSALRDVPGDDPDLVADVERAVATRRQRMVGPGGLEPPTSRV